MPNKNHFLILFLLITIAISCQAPKNFLHQKIETSKKSIGFLQIKTDTIFNSNQIISLLKLQKNAAQNFSIEFAFNQTDLKTTSAIAKKENAVAAINGGFFNMDSGGSVTYFEVKDKVINRRRDPKLKWGVTDSLMNGAIIIKNNFEITLEPANLESFYESSKEESAVLITGPLLLKDAKQMKFPNMKFVNKRHPRTCLCLSKDAIVFITIDGRQKEAEGMNLFELQKFLLSIGCIDAINLDGGGSTTMWTKDRGVVSFPSDKSGERGVANVLLIRKGGE